MVISPSDFHAFTGVVSLKRTNALTSPTMIELPRLHRRGLIEAFDGPGAILRIGGLPRLHRRGLIEAMSGRIRWPAG